jgi:carbon-monoxide dehydrogenase medium subunit
MLRGIPGGHGVGVERYTAPLSMDEAVALLAAQPGARPFAGATDLLVQMRAELRAPRALVDLKRIPGLLGVTLDAHGARIGAATPCAVLSRHAQLRSTWPGLVEAAALIGSKQVQGRASLGGNLCNASPAADSVPALVVNDAQAVVAGPDGTRTVPVAGLPRGPGRTALADDEFLVAIDLPRPAPRSADAYLRFIPRTEMDIAVAGAAVALTLDDTGRCLRARVALGAVGPTVLEVPEAAGALVGTRLDEAALAACAAAASAAARPIDDKRGSAEFRRVVIGVLVRRAALAAAARAHGQEG